MDIRCLCCREPWDVHHLLHDAIHETTLEEHEIEAWNTLTDRGRLATPYREALATAGYRFGTSLLLLTACPCCPEGTRPDPEHRSMAEAIAGILGDDHDAIAATFDDFGI